VPATSGAGVAEEIESGTFVTIFPDRGEPTAPPPRRIATGVWRPWLSLERTRADW
jgi:hypothetical protein